MKGLTTITLAALLVALSAHGQGTVNFSSLGASGGITNSATGARAVTGTTFLVALYFAPDGVTQEALFTQLGANTGIGPTAGFFSGGTRTAPAPVVQAGGFAHFQVRVWQSAFGTSYEQALGRGLLGTSGILRVDTGDPTTVPPGTPASLIAPSVVVVSGRALSQGIVLVPEPSTYALGLLGLGLVALLRRSRR